MNALCEIRDLGDRLVVINTNTSRRNALSPDLYAGIRQALDTAAAQPRIGAVILTGAGGFFCAGGDLNVLRTARTLTDDGRRAPIEDLAQLIRDILDCPRPVIAAVDGAAAGAGFSLAFACDLIVAARDAVFSAAYVSAGLVPDGGLTASLVAALPPALAAELLLTGRPIDAERLFDLGAINALADPGQSLDVAMAMAEHLARGPAAAQASVKTLVSGARRALMDRQLAAEIPHMARALASAEGAEGISSFLGKRAPDFVSLRRTRSDPT